MSFKKCECGYCDEMIPVINKLGQPARFKSGHNSKGKLNHNYKGGRTIIMGYYVITINGKRVLEQRYVMEQHLGRKLEPYEIVHHIDENKLNNDISNLELTTRNDHLRKYHKEKLLINLGIIAS